MIKVEFEMYLVNVECQKMELEYLLNTYCMSGSVDPGGTMAKDGQGQELAF